jgi:hypothetical protein
METKKIEKDLHFVARNFNSFPLLQILYIEKNLISTPL